jgi:hypothetical protein
VKQDDRNDGETTPSIKSTDIPLLMNHVTSTRHAFGGLLAG